MSSLAVGAGQNQIQITRIESGQKLEPARLKSKIWIWFFLYV